MKQRTIRSLVCLAHIVYHFLPTFPIAPNLEQPVCTHAVAEKLLSPVEESPSQVATDHHRNTLCLLGHALSYRKYRHKFRLKFPDQPVPNSTAIYKIWKSFRATGFILERNKTSRKQVLRGNRVKLVRDGRQLNHEPEMQQNC